MTRALIAGIGNLLFGDDGFGVEVARRLAAAPPAEATVADFGIRATHLAFELLAPRALFIAVDCMPRGGDVGLEDVERARRAADPTADPAAAGLASGHGMSLPAVFAAVRQLGGQMPPTLIVG